MQHQAIQTLDKLLPATAAQAGFLFKTRKYGTSDVKQASSLSESRKFRILGYSFDN